MDGWDASAKLDRMLSRRELLERAGAATVVAGMAPVNRLLESVAAWSRSTPVSSIDVARSAERWIRRSRIVTPDGVTWPANPLVPAVIDRSFYNGTPGIVLFLLELHHATNDASILAEAALGADDLIAHVPATRDPGLYTGLAGIAYVLAETARATGDAKYRTVAERARQRLVELPMPESTDIISGSAGIGLFLLASNEVDAARAHAERLMTLGQPAHGGLKWAITPRITNLYPNFSHGTAGVAYFLATLYERTRDERLVEAALSGHRYLNAVAIRGPQDDSAQRVPRSMRVFHHEPGGEDLFYLSWCHGPAGTARLYQRLATVAGEQMYADRVHQYARAIVEAGVPEKRSAGYWNNVSQCCGDAGVGEFFIALNRLRPSAAYAGMVSRIERHILSRATQDGETLRWTQAEHRVRPELLIAQTGFMQGAAGVGTFFLHADGARSGRGPFARMPDSPF
jgi:lantibiotic modifying enzyme